MEDVEVLEAQQRMIETDRPNRAEVSIRADGAAGSTPCCSAWRRTNQPPRPTPKNNAMLLKDKVILVTGAASGIGKTIAELEPGAAAVTLAAGAR